MDCPKCNAAMTERTMRTLQGLVTYDQCSSCKALAKAVVDGGVDEIDSGVQYGIEDLACLLLGNVAASRQPPQLHGSVPELRHFHTRCSERPTVHGATTASISVTSMESPLIRLTPQALCVELGEHLGA